MSHTSAAKESSIILRSAEGVFRVCLIDLKEEAAPSPPASMTDDSLGFEAVWHLI